MTRFLDPDEGHADLLARLGVLAGREVALWGAGPATTGWLAIPAVERLVSRIADPEPDHWGRRVNGIPVESPKALRERRPHALVVVGEDRGAELEELRRRGVELLRLPALAQSTFSKQYSASVART